MVASLSLNFREPMVDIMAEGPGCWLWGSAVPSRLHDGSTRAFSH